MSLLTRRRALLSAVNKGGLPSAYQQVEYLQSTGTQYIHTNIIPSNDVGFNIDISLNEIYQDGFVFGVRHNSGDTRFALGRINALAYLGFGKIYDNTWYIEQNKFFTAKLNFLNSKLANIDQKTPIKVPDIDIPFTEPLTLFGVYRIGALTPTQQRLKACKISKGNNIVCDFVPCYRKSDNKAGMYDLVNGEFYTNDGTGEFILGGEV